MKDNILKLNQNFCELSDPKFRRLLDQVFCGQCPQLLLYGSGGEKAINVCLQVVMSHAACRYGICYSSYMYLFVEY